MSPYSNQKANSACMINTKQYKIFKTLQRVSLTGLLVLIFSVPLQVHIFSQSNRLAVSQPAQMSQINTVAIEPISLLDPKTLEEDQRTKELLESQKSKFSELKIPLPKVVKPIEVVKPKIEPKVEPKRESEPEVKTPSVGDPSVQELKSLIASNCTKYSCNPDQLIRVMLCESGGTNHRNTYYKGPFQFLTSTFYANAKRAGIENADVLDARQQVQVASYMFGIGQAKQWGCK